ncbi:hypothetical protein COW36_12740 [bacterium (Candidatus Blackallbacteria) CG17_big_fil_post_rev_8_21_14_2_50_48_46]|uniref:Uncharacterized protein n=1 Tax=bacterium (Candidatus Blackallbacteria) CG17_big_fil_post_rev_8_21_14_2_50_48_46 TaxID=2014261 RepID=A0A2M7G412_9BACT|nr:MAG: hypothetical protein COW64_02520 [bacterium (Candidatus Blackallbacteria) CG18_big_fil_WC_8_21_14_2_50_49_26]PIW16628.1 MAG: hypothetical protein COW36_12740 [bacterium (Candidatus Blackallbacteria) CG17_big_fil_post_rev_8_21_14_2_50_48_46]PIW46136.1 MAG: hypothetical protein COW20_18005 [bacterium (Candidatus Blackallbacteria) CG13_big_fil_rev_8_21_14_2_50_49_14]
MSLLSLPPSPFSSDFTQWQELLEQLRFLPPKEFLLLWYWLLACLTEEASTSPPSRRSRRLLQKRQELWHLFANKSLSEFEELQELLPLEGVLLLLGRDLQVWKDPTVWQPALPRLYPCSLLILQLAPMIRMVPDWSRSLKQLLLRLAIQWLESVAGAEIQLELLGELTQIAQGLGLQTQAELLLEEMAVLLSQSPLQNQAGLAFDLGLVWLRSGYARPARFALKRWKETFPHLSQEAQRVELERMLFQLNYLELETVQGPLDRFSLLQAWVRELGSKYQGLTEESENGLLRLTKLVAGWQWPVEQNWLVDLKLEDLSPVQRAVYLGYREALGDQDAARALLAELPVWLARWGEASAAPLFREYWFCSHELRGEAKALLLHLQTATHLLKHSSGKRYQARRRQILAWGFSLIQPLTVSELKRQQKSLLKALSQGRKWILQDSPVAAQALMATLENALQEAQDWALAQEMRTESPWELRDWVAAVLALPAQELSSEHVKLLVAFLQARLPGWGHWILCLEMAQGLLPHLPWHEVKPYWQALFTDWDTLEAYQPLQALSALGLALAQHPPPEQEAWFAELKQRVEMIAPEWRADALGAVGHTQIWAGQLAAGFATLREITPVQAQLASFLRLGTVLRESNQWARYPEVMVEILACARRQTDPLSQWQGFLGVALVAWARADYSAGLKAMRDGIEQFLSQA